MENPNNVNDGPNAMLLELLLSETEKLGKVMAKKSITSAQIGKAISTINELRLSLEKQTVSDSLSAMGVKTDEPLVLKWPQGNFIPRYPIPRD